MYVSKMYVYVCGEKETEKKEYGVFCFFSSLSLSLFFFYHDRMLMLKTKWIVREKRARRYLSEESKSHNEITTIDDKSIGNSEYSNFFYK